MTDSAQQTRCPHCHTLFRVTEAQLAVADGRVRCGQCRSVFDATEHWETPPLTPTDPVEDSSSAAKEEPSGEEDLSVEEAPASDAFDTTIDEDLIFADDPDEDATETYYQGSAQDQEELSEDFLSLEEEEAASFARESSPSETPTHEPDDSWAESLLEEDETEDTENQSSTSELERDEEFELDEEFDLTSDTTTEAPLSEESDPESTPLASERSAPTAEHLVDMSVEETIAQTSRHDPNRAWQEVKALPITASSGEAVSPLRWLWRGLAVALLAAAVLQLTWLHSDRLARVELLRPVYAQACDWLGCELSPMVDTDRIRSRQLVIRSHPEQPGALLVEATLENRASFDQPFPAIHLSFRNLEQRVVAHRVFAPSEYLPDGEAPDRQLNAGHSVRVRLSIQDPGPDAINYRMDFMRLPEQG